MRLGIENVLSGMLIKHPNYEGSVVVESITQGAPDEGGGFGIYWKHVGADQTGGLLQGIPAGAIMKVDDPTLGVALRGSVVLLNDIWEDSGGWNTDQQYKTAARLLAVRVSALTCQALLRVSSDPTVLAEIEVLLSRRDLLLRSLKGSKGGLVI